MKNKIYNTKCKFCGKLFASRSSLNVHEKTTKYCVNTRLESLKQLDYSLYLILYQHYCKVITS